MKASHYFFGAAFLLIAVHLPETIAFYVAIACLIVGLIWSVAKE